jgi:hypothetical protein
MIFWHYISSKKVYSEKMKKKKTKTKKIGVWNDEKNKEKGPRSWMIKCYKVRSYIWEKNK